MKLPLKYRLERLDSVGEDDIDIVADKSLPLHVRKEALKRIDDKDKIGRYLSGAAIGTVGGASMVSLGAPLAVGAAMPIAMVGAGYLGRRGFKKNMNEDHPYFERVYDEGRVKRGEMSVSNFLNKWEGVKGVRNIQKNWKNEK